MVHGVRCTVVWCLQLIPQLYEHIHTWMSYSSTGVPRTIVPACIHRCNICMLIYRYSSYTYISIYIHLTRCLKLFQFSGSCCCLIPQPPCSGSSVQRSFECCKHTPIGSTNSNSTGQSYWILSSTPSIQCWMQLCLIATRDAAVQWSI